MGGVNKSTCRADRRMVLIDRLSPRHAPTGSLPFGYQRWSRLLFVNWAIDPQLLEEVIPKELELDLYNGKAYLSLVPFEMGGVRPSFSGQMGIDFLELNLRTYITFEQQPGVYFFSLDASSTLAVIGARLLWGLPYFVTHMTSSEGHPAALLAWHVAEQPFPLPDNLTHTYTSISERASCTVNYTIGKLLPPSDPGSLQYFLLERYFLFVTDAEGRVYKGQVHHSPYQAYAAEVVQLDQNVTDAARITLHSAQMTQAYWSPGVEISAFGPWQVRGKHSCAIHLLSLFILFIFGCFLVTWFYRSILVLIFQRKKSKHLKVM